MSVYLNTRWRDEHQRDRTRLFLAREIARARAEGVAAPDDLDWVEREGRRVVDQADAAGAQGVALFACRAAGLREIVSARTPFADRFTVDDRPDLAGLVALLDDAADALVVFVDGERARLVPVHPGGLGDEVDLAHDVPGRHRRGGWAQLAQSRYARHIEAHRGAHYEAVARAVAEVVDGHGIRRIVLAGQEDRLVEFQGHLPERVARLVVGRVPGAWWESPAALVERADERLRAAEQRDDAAAVDRVLADAAAGGNAAAGPATLLAAHRGAVHRLYVLAGLERSGRQCGRCGALQEAGPDAGPCALCGAATREVELCRALVDRVLQAGGDVEMVTEHAGLSAVGGFAARLRYRV